MKTLVFENSVGQLVELLTDLIDGNESFTIYQIQYRDANGKMQIGLSDALITAGFGYMSVGMSGDLGAVRVAAAELGYTVTATETGKEDVVIYQGTYYGGAIGVDLLDEYMY
jgi:hypothetical protein